MYVSARIGVVAVTLVVALGGVVNTPAKAETSQRSQARVLDVDADLLANGKIRLEAETAGATRVWFVYAGARLAARLVEVDREDGTREWARTVVAEPRHRASGRVVTIQVRACDGGGRCTVRSEPELLDREDG